MEPDQKTGQCERFRTRVKRLSEEGFPRKELLKKMGRSEK